MCVKGKKLSYIKPVKIAKFGMFSEFDQTWPKRCSEHKNLCGKFAKHNNNYKVVWNRNKLAQIKPCKIAKFWIFLEFDETSPKRLFGHKNLCGEFSILKL